MITRRIVGCGTGRNFLLATDFSRWIAATFVPPLLPARRAGRRGGMGVGCPLQTHRLKSVANKRRLCVPSSITHKTTRSYTLHFRKMWLHHAANVMMRCVSSMIFRGNHQTALIINNSFCKTHRRKAFRRLACEGRRSGSSHGESLRSQSSS